MTKTPIDHKRDSGGMAHIGTVEEGAAGLMVEIDGSLYIIKEKAIYALQHADQIDPEHTNIELPNIIPRHVLSVGSDSELVGKTLLTAVSLFDKWKFLPERFDHAKALSLSFEVLTTVVSMRTIAEEFETAQLKAHADANRGSPDGNSIQLPCMGDVQLFYSDIKKSPWDTLAERVQRGYGENDSFTIFLGQAVPFLKGVRNVRDGFVHGNTRGVITVSDFTLKPNGEIVPPTIEVDFGGTRHQPAHISQFMAEILNSMVTVFEMMIAHLCSIHYQPPAPIFPLYIDIPWENRKRWKHVRFYYGARWNGEFIPVG
jgi:hypothetical protein